MGSSQALRCALAASVFAVLLGTYCSHAATNTALSVQVPWRPGYARAFQTGAPEEDRARAAEGTLPVSIFQPPGAGPFPFVVLLHGCGGLHNQAMWTHWVEPWTELFNAHGVGTAVVDSFTPRGVEQVCTGNVAAWAERRADDAYSAGTWLAEQHYVDPARIALMGMSNGGRTVLAALRAPPKHTSTFTAGIALYPGCQSDTASAFHAPLLVLIGNGDLVTPARYCGQMKRAQPGRGSQLKLVIYGYAPHTFDMRLRDRTVLGMRLGYDAEATDDARMQVIEFLKSNGVIAPVR
ncbi:MAG: dienelactone hydrolase family protein [Burkholderiales bacterium]